MFSSSCRIVRVFALLIVVVASTACADHAPPKAETADPVRPYFDNIHDLLYIAEGFVSTRLEGQRQAVVREVERHDVDTSLPELDFDTLSAVMLGEGDAPVLAERVRPYVGKRVRIKGYGLPILEAEDAVTFVLHEDPFVQCLYIPKPAANRHLVVRLAEGVTFDFIDAPLWVEGVLRVGRFETFESGDLALYALDDARFEILPPERMDLPVVVPPTDRKEIHLRATH